MVDNNNQKTDTCIVLNRCGIMKKICGIYCITNKINGKKYIGQSVNIYKRFREHCYPSNKHHSYIDNAIYKYGKDNFVFEVIEVLPNDVDLLNQREEYWIKYYNTFEDDYHYNLTSGGDKIEFSEKTKQKISNSLKGKNNFWYGKKNLKHSKRMRKDGNPQWKKYPRLKKKGMRDNKQYFCIAYDGKDIIYSYKKDYLEWLIDSGFFVYLFYQKFNYVPRDASIPHLCFQIQYIKKQLDKIYIEWEKEKKRNFNSTGYYGVSLKKNKNYKQGFSYKYRWTENGKRKEISRINLEDLEKEVKKRGLKWECLA